MSLDRGRPALPPADLARRKLVLTPLPPADWHRIHRAAYDACFYSEDPGNRFSSPGLGVLYLADAAVTAFWEIFWDDLGPLPPEERRIPELKLRERVVRGARLERALTVFDATKPHSLKAVSATPGTFSGPYEVCQAWAKALSLHPSKPDGILYPSAHHAGASCLALFVDRTRCDDIAFGTETALQVSTAILGTMLDEGVKVLAA